MNLIFDNFESHGTKSLETVSTILLKNFMKKNNELITKYILNVDILMSVSNIFENFKYGLDSIFDSIKLKRNDSIFRLPKQILIGLLKFVGFFIYGISSSVTKFFVSLRNLTYYYYGNTLKLIINSDITEEDLKFKFFGFDALTEDSRKQLQNQIFVNKKFYMFYRYATIYGKLN